MATYNARVQVKIRMSSADVTIWKHCTEIIKPMTLRSNTIYHRLVGKRLICDIQKYTNISKDHFSVFLCALLRYFQPRVHHLVSNSLPCIVCILGLYLGRLKTQVRKTKVPEDRICKYGIRKYEYARVENASAENASTNLQRWKT